MNSLNEFLMNWLNEHESCCSNPELVFIKPLSEQFDYEDNSGYYRIEPSALLHAYIACENCGAVNILLVPEYEDGYVRSESKILGAHTARCGCNDVARTSDFFLIKKPQDNDKNPYENDIHAIYECRKCGRIIKCSYSVDIIIRQTFYSEIGEPKGKQLKKKVAKNHD